MAEVVRKAKLLPTPDRPFGKIVLVPLNGITIVRREFVMEVGGFLTKVIRAGITWSRGD